MGIYGAPYAAVIRENTFFGNPGLTIAQLRQYGVALNNGSATALKGHNLIEGNHFIRLNTPISLSGSQRAPNNVIRLNRIYGDPLALYMGPFTTTNTAISVNNNENVTVEANVIYSGADVAYHRGIYLWGGTTVSTQLSGLPGVFNNETCNVDVDLDPISADGGNFWNTCGTATPQ